MKALQIIFATIILLATFTTATAQSGIQSVEEETVAMSFEEAAALLLAVTAEEEKDAPLETIAVPSLGEQIRQAREAKKVSLETLAEISGLTLENVSNIESNLALPTRKFVSIMEKHLECEIVLDPRIF